MNRPPKIAESLMILFLLRRNLSVVLGDFEEIFCDILESKGKRTAQLWYWFQILKSFPGFVISTWYWSFVMFSNYVKITLRNIKRHKAFSIINISGLAIGMACCLLISLWIWDELSFDRFHKHADLLYRIEADEDYSGTKRRTITTPVLLAPTLEEEIPEVMYASRFTRFGGMQLSYQQDSFFEPHLRAADPSFFSMFSFPLVQGDSQAALKEPFSIVISERMAQKYFADQNPLGQVILAENQFEMIVTGVIQNHPPNSSLQYDWIVPFVFVEQYLHRMPEGWSDAISTFVRLRPESSIPDVNEKITNLIRQNRSKESKTEYLLVPLKRIRLFAHMGQGERIGTINHVYIFSLIAMLVLLIACINFMNLSTARSVKRAREIGMRKVVGAQRSHVIRQFYGESLLYTFFAFMVALILVIFFLPAFNAVSMKQLSVSVLARPSLIAVLFGISIFTGLLAGSYPALLLSALRPVKVLGCHQGTRAKNTFFRKTLVVMQFALSILLIIGTYVVYNQVKFMKTTDQGYNQEHLVIIPMRGELGKFYSVFKDSISQNPAVLGVTAMSRRPNFIGDYARDANWRGKDPDKDIRVIFAAVDYDWVETLGLEMVAGRSFSRDFPTDFPEAFLINEETAKLMQKDAVVGESFSMFGRKGKVIGVIRNFHFQPLRNNIEPLVLLLPPNPFWLGNIVIRIQPQDITAALDSIQETWKRTMPGFPFDFAFLDEDFDRIYWREARMGKLLGYFTFFAVFIACLGLFGLASFLAEQRTKEIGIRKVLGASVSNIVFSMCKEFSWLVVVANILAWPVAYLVAQYWLNDFAYRISLKPIVFLLTGLLALLIALVTVSFQAIKAGHANPVEALQYE